MVKAGFIQEEDVIVRPYIDQLLVHWYQHRREHYLLQAREWILNESNNITSYDSHDPINAKYNIYMNHESSEQPLDKTDINIDIYTFIHQHFITVPKKIEFPICKVSHD